MDIEFFHCSKCDAKFDNSHALIEHERHHANSAKEFMEKNPSKFKVGDIVFYDTIKTLILIDTVDTVKYKDDTYHYVYIGSTGYILYEDDRLKLMNSIDPKDIEFIDKALYLDINRIDKIEKFDDKSIKITFKD